MKKAVDDSNSTATDLANWFVINLNYTFREAYKLTGKIVAFCNKKNINLDQLTLKELKKFEKNITNKVFGGLSPQNSIKSKKSIGGTSPEQVKLAIKEARKKYL